MLLVVSSLEEIFLIVLSLVPYLHEQSWFHNHCTCGMVAHVYLLISNAARKVSALASLTSYK